MSINYNSISQNIDSLFARLPNANDSEKVEIYLKIGKHYQYNQYDSALYFFTKAEKISQRTGIKNLIAKAMDYKAITLINQGKNPEALLLLDSALNMTTDSSLICNFKNNLATIYVDMGLYEKAFKEFSEILRYYQKKGKKLNQAAVYANYAHIYDALGNYDTALIYTNKSLKLSKQIADTTRIIINLLNKGGILLKLDSLDESEKSLKEAEALAKKVGMSYILSSIYTNLGYFYDQKDELDKALFYHKKSLQIDKKFNDKVSISGDYMNLSDIYLDSGVYKKANEMLDSAAKYFKILPVYAKLNFYEAKNKYFDKTKNIDSAYFYYKLVNKLKDSLDVTNQEIKINFFQAEKNLDIAKIHLKSIQKISKEKSRFLVLLLFLIAFLFALMIILIFLFLRLKKSKKIDAIQLSLYEIQTFASKIDYLENIDTVLQKTLEKILEIKWLKIQHKGIIFLKNEAGDLDMVASENIGQIKQRCAKIKAGECLCGTSLQQKKVIIETQISNNHTIKTANIQAHGHYIAPIKTGDNVIGILNLYFDENHKIDKIEQEFLEHLTILLAGIIDRKQKTIKIAEDAEKQDKLNQKLFAQSLQLEQQKAELQDTLEQLEQQSNLLEHTLLDLSSSINYASYIVKSLLPSEKYLKSIFKDYFLIFRPIEEIGGDFYFAKKIGKKIFFAVGDATGHGVPGAFLATQAITFLNGIIDRSEALEPSDILTSLRIKIKNIFDTANVSIKYSSIDLAFCVVDTEDNTLTFAGAYMPLIIIRNEQIIKLKGVKTPIGFYISEKEFVQQKIQLQNNDMIYLQSDGYADQFGGENYKKLTVKVYEQFLLQIHNLPLEKQKYALLEKHDQWKGDNSQIDDITILGIRWNF